MKSMGLLEELMDDGGEQGWHGEQLSQEWHGLIVSKDGDSRMYRFAKRTLDIVGALIGLIILGLILPVILVLFLFKDRGPLFYKQQRVGRDMKPFTLYKLRTMIVDADGHLARHPGLQAAWSESGKLRHDPRITRLGSFLRRSSIDELPQFFNVLRGDLSLVGPRPVQFSEIPVFGELIKLRQSVKPGLTGLWQIRGRSNTDYAQRAILDCMYVMDRSFWIDLLIIFKTFPAVLHGTDAF